MANEADPAIAEAFELAPAMMGVVELTDDDDILHVRDNRATCAFFGVQPGETTNRRATALGASRETIDVWLRHYRASDASGLPVRFEYAFRGGEDRWLQVVVGPVGIGGTGRPRFMYVADDITAHKKAERAAADAEARAAAERLAAEQAHADLSRRTLRLETMFRENLIGTVTWTLRGGVTTANEAFRNIVGVTQADIAAGRVSWRELTPPEYEEIDRAKVEEWSGRVRTRRSRRSTCARTGRGRPCWCRRRCSPDSEDEGLSYIVDLTPVKAAERRIRGLLDDGHRRLAGKGRVHRHPGARAAQPAGADPQRAADPANARRHRAGARVRPRDVIERQVAAHGAAGGRSAGRLAGSRAASWSCAGAGGPRAVDRAARSRPAGPLIEAAATSCRVHVPRGELCIDGDPRGWPRCSRTC